MSKIILLIYVFEQYMVSDHPKHSPDVSLPTDQNEEFSCVFRTRLGHHYLLYGAEMDGLKIDDKLTNTEEPINDAGKLKDLLEKGLAKFVELKSSADASINKREWSKICRFKSLRWWVQCYMGGIQEVVCGYRGEDGIIRSLQTFRVETLPQLGQGHWNPDVCLDYCSRFLDLVTNHVSNGPDEVIWSFIWNPQHPDNIEIGQVNKDSQYSFLHRWFTDEFKKNAKRKSDTSPSSLRESSDKSKAKVKIG
ncbi:hypothetical protein J437_LFUL009915 [Ladona fulva]|uniref:Decapping nuclease n=1 Tax=Ladona fulva TaxID=123851 RepID=A0A8K0NYN3_LADFU|nr:hypothetical protein J437_LFUL009915 [Ladona fulva]